MSLSKLSRFREENCINQLKGKRQLFLHPSWYDCGTEDNSLVWEQRLFSIDLIQSRKQNGNAHLLEAQLIICLLKFLVWREEHL